MDLDIFQIYISIGQMVAFLYLAVVIDLELVVFYRYGNHDKISGSVESTYLFHSDKL